MDLAFEYEADVSQNVRKGLVSILVLVDLAFEFLLTRSLMKANIRFNPCFSGSCIRIREYKRVLPDLPLVSILVLVDLAFESNGLRMKSRIPEGFNPCFSGSCIRITG